MFKAAGDGDAFRADADRDPAWDILGFGDEDVVEHVKDRLDEGTKGAIAALGPRREPGVNEGNRDSGLLRGMDKVRPNLGLDQDEMTRTNRVHRSMDAAGKVERVVNHRHGGREFRASHGVASAGGGREDDRHGRPRAVERGDKFGSHKDFADAHGVDPARLFEGGEAGPDLGAVESEALREIGAIAAAPPHLQERRGQGREQCGRQREIV